MPVGDRRSSRSRALRGGGCTSFAPLWGAVLTGGRRSLAVPALYGGVAVRRSHPCGVRCRSEVGVPWRSPRFGELGGVAVRRSHPCGVRCRPEVGVPWLGVVGGAGWLFVVSRPSRAAMPVGDRRSSRSRASRGGGCTSFAPLWGAVPAISEVGVPWRDRRRRGLAVRGFAALRAAVPVGDRRFQAFPRFTGGGCTSFAPCGVARCRPEVGVPLLGVVGAGWLFVVSRPSRAAMPVGDRRSSRSRALRGGGCTSFAPRRGAVPAGGRRSLAGGAIWARSGTRFRGPVGRDAGRRPALRRRCRAGQ